MNSLVFKINGTSFYYDKGKNCFGKMDKDISIELNQKIELEIINREIQNYVDLQQGQPLTQYTLCLHPSRKCNFACKYCFGKDLFLPKEDIDIKIAKKAIDFLVFNLGNNAEKYVVDLAG